MSQKITPFGFAFLLSFLTIRVASAVTSCSVETMKLPKDVLSVRVSSDASTGFVIRSDSRDDSKWKKQVDLYDIDTAKRLVRLQYRELSHDLDQCQFDLSKDRRYVMAYCLHPIIWDAKTGILLWDFYGVRNADFNRNTNQLVYETENAYRVIDLDQEGKELARFYPCGNSSDESSERKKTEVGKIGYEGSLLWHPFHFDVFLANYSCIYPRPDSLFKLIFKDESYQFKIKIYHLNEEHSFSSDTLKAFSGGQWGQWSPKGSYVISRRDRFHDSELKIQGYQFSKDLKSSRFVLSEEKYSPPKQGSEWFTEPNEYIYQIKDNLVEVKDLTDPSKCVFSIQLSSATNRIQTSDDGEWFMTLQESAVRIQKINQRVCEQKISKDLQFIGFGQDVTQGGTAHVVFSNKNRLVIVHY